jgi:8-oxo-dGTP diphosphatase
MGRLRKRTEAAGASVAPGMTNRPLPEIEVVAGALFDAREQVLIAQRPPGKVLAGRWEFPGGKLNAGEDPFAGLVRELGEELGVTVRTGERLIRYAHDYPERRVWLDMWIVTAWHGTIRALEGQALRWVAVDALPGEDILEADQPIVESLLLRRSTNAAAMPPVGG